MSEVILLFFPSPKQGMMGTGEGSEEHLTALTGAQELRFL